MTFIAAALALNAFAGERGLLDLVRVRSQERRLSSAIGELRTQNSALRTEVQRLKEDPSMIEAIARRELGLLRKGEVLIVVKN
ncbi:MAG TPA: septum formation initiator family protein [Vicinamibacterales bacterium]|nr:septum formation initiator family protein [Vicinamibacterales bacterium]